MFAVMPIALGHSIDGCQDDPEDPASEYNSDCAIIGLKMRFGMRQSRADKYSLRPGLMFFQVQAHCRPLIVSTKLRVFKDWTRLLSVGWWDLIPDAFNRKSHRNEV